ncbi:MAG TPA: dienelactone hydrolase family protein [Thermoanaerobaculia bacterium]
MPGGMIDMESNTTLVQCYPAHEAYPDGAGPFPALLLFHDKFGLTSDFRGTANRLAREGFYTLAPNFYAVCASFADVAPEFMRTAGPSGFGPADESSADSFATGLTDDRAAAVIAQALAYVAGRSHARGGGVGVLGFSMGGRLALRAACLHPDAIRACVAFTPERLTRARSAGQPAVLDDVDRLRAPVLILYGGLDENVRAAEREAVRARLADLGKDVTVEVFREAPHDFMFGDRETYRVGPSKRAWSATLAFLRQALEKG